MDTPAAPTPSPRPDPQGADHATLQGATSLFRFRPQRLTREDLGDDLRCRLVVDGSEPTSYPVVDVSRWGLAFRPEGDVRLIPGQDLDEFELLHRDDVVWRGTAQVVRQEDGSDPRVGVKLTSAPVDLEALLVRETVVEHRLSGLIEGHERTLELLPQRWIAEVGLLQQALHRVKEAVQEAEVAVGEDGWWHDEERCEAVVEAIYRRWEPTFRTHCLKLERMSAGFTPEQVQLGHGFAQRALMPILMDCPMHRRAYEKPLGYAGDYRLMELIQEPGLEGDTFFGRFLHHVGRSYTLAETVRQRSYLATAAVRKALRKDGPVRIASMACGPAVELRRAFQEHGRLQHPVDLVLIDQDEQALATAHREMQRVLTRRDDADLVTLHCLHFSIRQIVLPKRGAEQELVDEVLHDFDLVYSMGLYDYILQPLAQRVTAALWKTLGPGGRLFIGNLKRVADSSWMMEYGTEWNLIYRNDPEMRDLGARLDPPAPKITIRRDATRRCLFFDATKPSP